MSRELPSSIVTATTAPIISPVVFVDMDFPSGHVRLHSAYGPITFRGEEFGGLGGLGRVSQVEESMDPAQGGVTFELSNVPDTVLATLLLEQYQGRSIRAWVALITQQGNILDDGYEFFTGRMGVSNLSAAGDSSRLGIVADSELSDLRRSRERRFTHEDRRRIYPAELGFQYMTALQDRTIMWGKMYRPGETQFMSAVKPTTRDTSATGVGVSQAPRVF